VTAYAERDFYYLRDEDMDVPRSIPGGPVIQTPNGQQITGLRAPGRRLFVHTRSRIYYLRRNKLRLWRVL
jgi:hypothetical protein